MKIIHRISLTPRDASRELLLSLGLELIEIDNPMVRLFIFEIEEGDASWPRVKELIPEWDAPDWVRTEFSECEVEAANLLQIFATTTGYPQPTNDFGYRKATYDLRDYCQTCGIGRIQGAPFRIKGEPKWGKKQIFQLNWVHDEFFVRPQLWETVFRPLGIGCSVVLDHRSGKELETVVQLAIKDVAPSPLTLTDYSYELCGDCCRKKYLPICRGFFPPFVTDPPSQFFRTQEYFGSGASAWHATIITSNLYRSILSYKVPGMIFVPLENKGEGKKEQSEKSKGGENKGGRKRGRSEYQENREEK